MTNRRFLPLFALALLLGATASTSSAAPAPKVCPKGKFLATVKEVQPGPKTVRVLMADPKTGQPVDDVDVRREVFDKDFKAYKVGATVCHREPGQD
jgi:hypothetical protein